MPPGAERREEADEAGSRNSQKKEQKSLFSIPQKKRRTHDFTKIMCPEVQGTLPCREIFKRQAAS
jgi:hypothetical protein